MKSDDFLTQAFTNCFNVRFITNWKSLKNEIENNQNFIDTQQLRQPLTKIMQSLCKAPYINKLKFINHKLNFGFEVGAWFRIETDNFTFHYSLDYDFNINNCDDIKEKETLFYSTSENEEEFEVNFSQKNINKIIKLFYDYQKLCKH
jgi:hypothetical protein